MNIDLSTLKEFLDYGGVFVITIVLLFGWIKKLDRIEDRLVKILTLLTVLTKEVTSFNHTDRVLGKDRSKVEGAINNTAK